MKKILVLTLIILLCANSLQATDIKNCAFWKTYYATVQKISTQIYTYAQKNCGNISIKSHLSESINDTEKPMKNNGAALVIKEPQSYVYTIDILTMLGSLPILSINSKQKDNAKKAFDTMQKIKKFATKNATQTKDGYYQLKNTNFATKIKFCESIRNPEFAEKVWKLIKPAKRKNI